MRPQSTSFMFFPTSLCGVLVFGCALPSASFLPAVPLCPTHTPLTHTPLTHTQLTLTQLTHTQLIHTHTTYHTQLTHTHNLPTHTHNLPTHTTYPHTTYTHTQLTHTHTNTPLTHTHTHNFPNWHTHTHTTQPLTYTWQTWRLRHWAGSGDELGSHLTQLTPRPFAWQAWQAWHLLTSTVTLQGTSRDRRGTWRHRAVPIMSEVWKF